MLLTWKQLFGGLFATLAVYYSIYFFLFSRKGWGRAAADNNQQVAAGPSGDQVPAERVPIQQAPAIKDDLLYQKTLELTEELKLVFDKAASMSLEKEAVLVSLQIRLQQYPDIKQSAFYSALNQHIIEEVERACHIQLTAEELAQLWPS